MSLFWGVRSTFGEDSTVVLELLLVWYGVRVSWFEGVRAVLVAARRAVTCRLWLSFAC